MRDPTKIRQNGDSESVIPACHMQRNRLVNDLHDGPHQNDQRPS
jgi:hypothetical protein